MDQELIIEIGLISVGVLLLLLAVIMRRQLIGKRVVDLTAEKLGLALRTDAFGLVVLIGLLLVGSPIFLWYKGYEGQLSSLQQKVNGLEASLAEFKEQDLTLSLVFTGNDIPDINKVKPPIAYVQRVGERAPKPYDLVDFVSGPGGLVARFKKLKEGDLLYVVVEEGGKKWRSHDMVAPGGQVEMEKVTDQ
jgi:hypothetical protein